MVDVDLDVVVVVVGDVNLVVPLDGNNHENLGFCTSRLYHHDHALGHVKVHVYAYVNDLVPL